MSRLMASDFMHTNYCHALTISTSTLRFFSYISFLAGLEKLYTEAADMNIFAGWHLDDKLDALWKGKDVRSNKKGAADLAVLEGYPTPDEVKAAVQRAIIYLEILSNYLHSEGAALDWKF